MKNIKLTVVTPVFNLIKNHRQDDFVRCLSSVHNQTYENIEYLIIDGASTDGTLEFLKPYEDKEWIKVYSEKDEGVYDAFNKGINKASGDYIMFLGSDDILYSNNSAMYLMEAIEKTEADWAYGHTYYKKDENLYFWQGTIKAIPFGSGPCHQSIIVSTAAMKRIGGFELNNAIADIDVMMKLIKYNYKSIFVDRIISIFSEGGWSTTEGFSLQRNDFVQSFYNILGKDRGLTLTDCQNLYAGKCYGILSPKELFSLGMKLRNYEWVTAFFNRDFIILRVNPKQPSEKKCTKKIKFLGVPLLKIYSDSKRKKISILGIRIVKIQYRHRKKKIYFMGIPTITIKED